MEFQVKQNIFEIEYVLHPSRREIADNTAIIRLTDEQLKKSDNILASQFASHSLPNSQIMDHTRGGVYRSFYLIQGVFIMRPGQSENEKFPYDLWLAGDGETSLDAITKIIRTAEKLELPTRVDFTLNPQFRTDNPWLAYK